MYLKGYNSRLKSERVLACFNFITFLIARRSGYLDNYKNVFVVLAQVSPLCSLHCLLTSYTRTKPACVGFLTLGKTCFGVSVKSNFDFHSIGDEQRQTTLVHSSSANALIFLDFLHQCATFQIQQRQRQQANL